jgi:hypothetical protein
VLADELGLALTLRGTEVPVGDFRLDIQAETLDGRVVVIENQLDKTDHGHLGQLLVYASGLEAAAVVWVAPRFRDEFRRTLDWLNERTDTGVDFFGVEIGVVPISDSGPRAPVFEVVSRPNAWQKDVKESGTSTTSQGAVTPLNASRQDFFGEVLSEVTTIRPAIRMPTRQRVSWLSYAAGPFGSWSISAIGDGRVRVEAYIDMGDRALNKQLFDDMLLDAVAWSNAVGEALSWERLDERRASRICLYHSAFSFDDDEARTEARTWAVQAAVGMYDALNKTLRGRAKQLRAAGTTHTAPHVDLSGQDHDSEVGA